MNINTKAKRILCYGDSNTWGYIPGTGERFSIDMRWTGILQKSLGNQFEVIEEGLNSRTTKLTDPKNDGKNGIEYLKPCLQTHYPLDLVILMLGTNDLKERFSRTPEQITEGIEELLLVINNPDYNYDHKPKILLLAPPLVDESVSGVSEKYLGAEEKSKRLSNLYKQLADKYKLNYINVAEIVKPSNIDGYHLDSYSHNLLAERILQQLKKAHHCYNSCMENIEIVTLTSEWWQQYRDLRLRALKEEPQAYGSTHDENAKRPDEYWEQRLANAFEEKTQWLVFAKSENKLVGMIGAFAEKEPDNAHIIAVYIVPEAREKGISKLLMNDIIERIKGNLVVKKITVDVNPEQLAALNLYKGSGFKVIKQYKMVLGDGKEHDVHQLQMQVNKE